MRKSVKRVVIPLVFTVLICFAAIYFSSIRNAYDLGVYFTAESSITNWISGKQTAFAWQNENFSLRFYENGNLVSARKDGVFWVRNDHTIFPSNETHKIRATEIGDTFYVYGVTAAENVQKVKLIYNLGELSTVFHGKQVTYQSRNVLCFCVEIPKGSRLPNASLAFTDGEDRILDEVPASDDDTLDLLLETVFRQAEETSQRVNSQVIGTSSLRLTKQLKHKFFLNYAQSDRVLEEYTQTAQLHFFDDFVLLEDQKRTVIHGKNNEENFYDISYKMEYTDELLQLKQYAQDSK